MSEGQIFVKTWSPICAGTPDKSDSPILLLHESLGCVALWKNFPAQLASVTSRRVIAYDRLGFGRSDPHPGTIDRSFVFQEGHEFLPAFCARAGISRFVACGHSVGGSMAVTAAACLPQICEALITLSALSFVEERTIQGVETARRIFQNPLSFEKLERYHGTKARWVLDSWVNTWLSPEFSTWDLNAVAAAVCCPILALHGEFDEYGSIAQAKRIVRQSGRLKVLPQMGHMLHRDNPELIAELIAEFL
ncbi:alpha/beta fold hydrolase [Acetobacter senegalensis]|uniref:alpha/beta fold hydrolase n=1 Tax=Acetobacter senegalensis TaxID=446692 RepID=UPI0026505338|nr:alpha/beta hydrolase [Acetobacter senegalensis]MDN7356261.1 alpha/beta hydrolase [Acetobacter senegalensis]